MSSGFFGFGLFLFTLPVLIAQWVGIVGLGKVNRGRAWWCMTSGAALSSVGFTISGLFVILMMSNISTSDGFGVLPVISAMALPGIGSLLFAIGFALHGLQASRANQRINELEAIAAAQGEELNRQRAAQGSAG